MSKLKKIIRKIIPRKIRFFIWSAIPEIHKVNTLYMHIGTEILDLVPIPDKYKLHEVSWKDEKELRKFFEFSGPGSFERKVPVRLNSKNCKGFAYIDTTTGEIAYLNWFHHHFGHYLKEFGIVEKEENIFWDSALCLPEHRHNGLHERMEQELFNYTFRNRIKHFYMQIYFSNRKGNEWAVKKGYKLLNTKPAIYWPLINVYRNLGAFLLNPFKKMYL